VLLLALVATRTCASNEENVTADEAMAIALEQAPFVPCEPKPCRQIHYVNRGIPVVGYWAIVLSEEIEDGRPTRIASYLVHSGTGEVSVP
jgi:hypothetical protein